MVIKEKFSAKSEYFDWLETICASIIVIIIAFTFILRTVTVDGPSMIPTLKNGDRVVLLNSSVTKIDVGDVVVITQPTTVGHPIIKRVIAKEGQTVDIDFDTGDVYVDGIKIEEEYINEKIMYKTNNSVSFPFVVGEGKLFVMGDNRNNSSDSRYAGIGAIDTRYVLGKAVYRFYPIDDSGVIK